MKRIPFGMGHIVKLKGYLKKLIKVTGIRYCLYKNDPSAGSPTKTLLRLLLPTNKKI
jgi:hypothetical protein